MRFFHKYKNHTTFENRPIILRKPDVSLCSIEGSKRNGMHYNYLPYDAEVEYLECTGTQYIDTGISSADTTEISIDAKLSEIILQCRIIGNDSGYFEYYVNGSSRWSGIANGTAYSGGASRPADMNRHVFKLSNITNKAYLDSDTWNMTHNTSTYWNKITLFGRNPGQLYSKGYIYSAQIKENGTLVRDFIPVRVGTIGYLYDKVSGKLFGNAGSGNFTLGQDIIPIEYIRSSGTEYIDTGIYGTMDLDFYIEFEPTELGTAYQKTAGSIFGSRSAYNSRAYQLTTYNKVSSYSASTRGHFLCANNYGWNDNKTPTANMLLNKKNIIKKENLLFTRADGTTFTLTSQSFTTAASIRIFQCAGAGEPSKIKLYNLKFSRNGNILRNFIPVRVGTVGYLFDKVNRQLYGNAGSGAFTLGPDIT